MAVSIADKIRFLRYYTKVFESKNGYRIVGDSISNLTDSKLEKIESYYNEIRRVMSAPVKVVRARSEEIKNYFNDFESLALPSKDLKVYFARVAEDADKVKVVKNSYYSDSGRFRKYYFKIDVIKAVGKNGVEYINNLIKDIPSYYELRFKMVSVIEFNGVVSSSKMFVDMLNKLANKYYQALLRGEFLNQMVVYAYIDGVIDEQELGVKMEEYMTPKKRAKSKKIYRR
jgi:hypothetical protein